MFGSGIGVRFRDWCLVQGLVRGMLFGALIQVEEEHFGENSPLPRFFSRYRHEIWYGYFPTIPLSMVQISATSHIPESSYKSTNMSSQYTALHNICTPHAHTVLSQSQRVTVSAHAYMLLNTHMNERRCTISAEMY